MYESPIMLLETDPLIQCVKNETDNMIIQGVARVGVHVDKDELIKALEYDRRQYEKGFHDGRMYVPPCPSNEDKIKAMSTEDLATFLCNLKGADSCYNCIANEYCHYGHNGFVEWLKQECET